MKNKLAYFTNDSQDNHNYNSMGVICEEVSVKIIPLFD